MSRRHYPHWAVTRVYDSAGNVIETHERAGDSKSGENCLDFSALLASFFSHPNENARAFNPLFVISRSR
jgi:hypothetical protein